MEKNEFQLKWILHSRIQWISVSLCKFEIVERIWSMDSEIFVPVSLIF
jgi:hypothetical protein